MVASIVVRRSGARPNAAFSARPTLNRLAHWENPFEDLILGLPLNAIAVASAASHQSRKRGAAYVPQRFLKSLHRQTNNVTV